LFVENALRIYGPPAAEDVSGAKFAAYVAELHGEGGFGNAPFRAMYASSATSKLWASDWQAATTEGDCWGTVTGEVVGEKVDEAPPALVAGELDRWADRVVAKMSTPARAPAKTITPTKIIHRNGERDGDTGDWEG
jgi:hypothetical protein